MAVARDVGNSKFMTSAWQFVNYSSHAPRCNGGYSIRYKASGNGNIPSNVTYASESTSTPLWYCSSDRCVHLFLDGRANGSDAISKLKKQYFTLAAKPSQNRRRPTHAKARRSFVRSPVSTNCIYLLSTEKRDGLRGT
jgi:hypothetical protein